MKRIPFTICFCHVVGSRVLQKTISKHRREVSLSGVEKWEESSVFWAPLIPSVKDCGRINSIFVRFLKIYDTSSELSSFVYLTIYRFFHFVRGYICFYKFACNQVRVNFKKSYVSFKRSSARHCGAVILHIWLVFDWNFRLLENDIIWYHL